MHSRHKRRLGFKDRDGWKWCRFTETCRGHNDIILYVKLNQRELGWIKMQVQKWILSYTWQLGLTGLKIFSLGTDCSGTVRMAVWSLWHDSFTWIRDDITWRLVCACLLSQMVGSWRRSFGSCLSCEFMSHMDATDADLCCRWNHCVSTNWAQLWAVWDDRSRQWCFNITNKCTLLWTHVSGKETLCSC